MLIDSTDLGRLTIANNTHKYKGNLKYSLRETFSGRLIFDIYELSLTMIKLDSY